MDAMDTLRVAQGEDLLATVQLRYEGLEGEITGVYTGGEPLDLDLWQGGRQTEVALPASTVAWHDAGAGQLALALGRADTAALAPGLWFLRIWLTDGPARLLAYEARLHVLPSAGSEAALPCYGTLTDLYALAPWLDQVLAQHTHLRADLSEPRHQARQRIDGTILARAEAVLRQHLERHAPVQASDPIRITTGVDAGPEWGASLYPDTSVRDQLDQLRAHLDADRLLVDGPCREIAASLALALALRPLLGNGPGGTPYQQLGAALYRTAMGRLRGWTARIDTNGDGVAEQEIL